MEDRVAKDVGYKDNYLIATVGELNGEPVWLNLAYSSNGEMKWFSRSKHILIPDELHNKFYRIIDHLEKKTNNFNHSQP